MQNNQKFVEFSYEEAQLDFSWLFGLDISDAPLLDGLNNNKNHARKLIRSLDDEAVFTRSCQTYEQALQLMKVAQRLLNARAKQLRLWTDQIQKQRLEDVTSLHIARQRQELISAIRSVKRTIQAETQLKQQVHGQFKQMQHGLVKEVTAILLNNSLSSLSANQKELRVLEAQAQAMMECSCLRLQRSRERLEEQVRGSWRILEQAIQSSWDL